VIKIQSENEMWSLKSWLWVFLCSIGIFSTIPVERAVQVFVYDNIGRDFFTYAVLVAVFFIISLTLYFFLFKLKVRKTSQYIWLFICAGIYIYFTVTLREHPEEAVHFLEYGLLSFFLFRAFSHKIKDNTVYITAALGVLFIGTMDEFLQWLMPKRFWDYRDIGINALAGSVFLLAVWKGIKPKMISGPVKKFSITMLASALTLNLITLGLCLSNTPETVNRYSTFIDKLSWLRHEEPMTEFGYKHKDAEIGSFFSRMTLEELEKIDRAAGIFYGKMLPKKLPSETEYKAFLNTYNPNTNPFLHEFLIHLSKRNGNFKTFTETGDIHAGNVAFRVNTLMEQYFTNTLKNSVYRWPEEKIKNLPRKVSLEREIKVSNRIIITSFRLRTGLLFIIFAVGMVWISAQFWKRHLDS
jgi:hypothetical protein